jgi:hypothetical protein
MNLVCAEMPTIRQQLAERLAPHPTGFFNVGFDVCAIEFHDLFAFSIRLCLRHGGTIGAMPHCNKRSFFTR